METKVIAVLVLLIVLLGVVFSATINILPDSTSPSVPTVQKSVVYYAKLVNKAIVENDFSYGHLTKEDASALKEKETGKISVDSEKTVDFDKINQIKWKGILDSGNSSVSFNKVKINGVEYQLSVTFVDSVRRLVGFKPIEVKVDGGTVPCQAGWGVLLNASVNMMVLGSPLEKQEICKYQVGSGDKTEYVLYISSLDKVGGKYEITMRSPIIPNSCPGEIIGTYDITKPIC